MVTETPAAITAHAITLASRVRVSPEVLLQDVGGESVLLDIASETYFGLNAVGTRIWQLLDDGSDLRSVHATILMEYDVPATQLEQETLVVLGQLADAGLVAIE